MVSATDLHGEESLYDFSGKDKVCVEEVVLVDCDRFSLKGWVGTL